MAGLALFTMDNLLRVSVSEALLLAGFESATPAAAMTDALFRMFVVAVPATVPDTV